MSTVDKTSITTAEQLLQLPDDFGPCELVRGELIMMSPGGWEHAQIQAVISNRLFSFAKRNRLGSVVTSEAGFILDPDERTVRVPDVAFVRADREPQGRLRKFFPGPPDLAVEIRSPNDGEAEILAKITLYLEVGVQVVWDVDAEAETVTVYRKDCPAETLHTGDTLTEPGLLPGFEIEVRDIFAWD